MSTIMSGVTRYERQRRRKNGTTSAKRPTLPSWPTRRQWGNADIWSERRKWGIADIRPTRRQ
uniref:Uncharacterized protein n=1 Tax=Cucumis melo TaxID=3656 RepID=A0A9I9D460_CUCME